ncbi:hypothetical protein ACH4NS_16905 [Streptomyces mutabilis]|uniref:hypothetical protein n=1 Tax=Streptomyces mutabilis TaxID=67332 RepID=UPI00379544BD
MTDLNTRDGGVATGTGDRSRPRAALPALCATQITSWGIVYYAFPVLNPQITAATGWPTGATTAAFSLALVVSALAGIRVGRILDQRGPRTVMTLGSVLGVVSLLGPRNLRCHSRRRTAVRRGQTGMFRERLANGRESMST